MIYRKLSRIGTLLLSLLVLVVLTGCSTTVTLYPIDKTDIFSIEKGSIVHYRDGETVLVETDGLFLSEMYLDEVAKARIEKK
jgi:hypothetical protein